MALQRQGRMEEYSVYILFSKLLNKYYVGQTNNFEERLQHHNKGSNKYTSKGVPWIFIHKIAVTNRKTALLLENKIKKRGIKRFLVDINFGM